MAENFPNKTHVQTTKHCCKLMDDSLEDTRICIGYSPVFRSYYILLKKSYAVQCIDYCPWCNKKLPLRLRKHYFEALLNEYNIDDDEAAKEEGRLPEEFKTDAWWKKRGL